MSSDSESGSEYVDSVCSGLESDGELPDNDLSSGVDQALNDDQVGFIPAQDENAVADIERQVRRFSTVPPDAEDEDNLFDGNLNPVGYYQQLIDEFNEDDFKHKEYSKGTIKLIQNSENQWRRFCLKVLRTSNWQKVLQKIKFRLVYAFLHWHLSQTTGKGGRSKRRVKTKASLVTFWCCFRLAFERQTCLKIDDRVNRSLMHNALVELGNRYKLTHKTRENRSLTLEDLKDQIELTLQTTEKSFKLGEQRVLAVLFLLLLAPAGSRPTSILELRFGDINVLLIRDPAHPQAQPRLVIRLSLEYTKRYLGRKATKHFMIPEIIYDPSLFLSPHVFLLAVLFRHRAFLSEPLNNDPHLLSRLKIHPSGNELPLSLKPELNDVHLFRRTKKTLAGFVMSEEPITYDTMRTWINRIGKLLGFEHNTICYNLRYMAGNNLDQNVNVSDSLRNLILDHAPGSDTFQKHYLNRNVVADLWAIHRKEQPQQALLQQATSHGHSRNSRRPVDLTPEQSAALKEDPKYKRLSEQLSQLPPGPRFAKERLRVTRERHTLQIKLRAAELQRVLEEFKHKQSVEDVERQAQGEDFSALSSTAINSRTTREMSKEQRRMVEALEAPLVIGNQGQRRTNAILALRDYCWIEEVPVNKLIDSRQAATPPGLPSQPGPSGGPSSTGNAWKQTLKDSVFTDRMTGAVRRCFICVAQAVTLPPHDPNIERLSNEFYSMPVLGRHLMDVHLSLVEEDEATECPLCETVLIDKMHVQNHAEVVHGLKSSKKWKMR
ncbi:Uu.00g104880.m01.CDS01 [Anthostomella pinea]|uniref:Uu.00g104880.m01.CDS01 n=1 Tax=Anthostomella pinea TaxID=933095 RepID=A0AAI8VEC2_9PEZI|nr:Uu.00g104880.m01.CDS01 [Anthostomella pinea]